MTGLPRPPLQVRVRLRLLGAPALQALQGGPAGGAAAERPLGRNDALLLALLALDGAQPRSRVAALIWPDHAEAARNLRQRVHQLKRAAGCDVAIGDPLLTLADGVQHDLQPTDADLDRWLQADPQALRTPLLDGVPPPTHDELAELLLQWRQRWGRRLHDALRRGADSAWASGQSATALALLRRRVEHHPGDEGAHRSLIERLHQLGDRAAAVAAYGDCRRQLQLTLGLQPAAETELLMQRVRGEGLPPRPAPAAAPARASAPAHPPRLIARDQPWQAALAALDAGRPVLLTGDAGIGKTRLLTDLAAARGGWPVVSARPSDADLPYALLARVVDRLVARHGAPATAWVAAELARLVPGLGAADTEPFTALRLQRAVLAALQAWAAVDAQPRLQGLALDDLHLADRATLDLLAALMAEAGATPGWLLAARADDLQRVAPGWGPQPDGSGACRLALTELDSAGVQALLLTLPQKLPLDGVMDGPTDGPTDGPDVGLLAARLHRLTGGNPLFVLQAVAALQAPDAGDADATLAPVPSGDALAWMARRIERLDPAARQLLRLAAVAGDAISPALAGRVFGQPPLALGDAWARLETAQLVLDGQVAHDLVRQAALLGLPAALIHDTHASVARVLAEDAAPPAQQARHWQAAQAWPQAAAAWDAAALAAHARSATAEEVAALRASMQAAAADPAPGPAGTDADTRLQRGLRLVHALLRGFMPVEALVELQGLTPVLRQPAQRLQWLLLHAKLLADQQQCEQALASADEALALLATAAGADDEEPLRLLAQQRRAMALMGLDRVEEALAAMPEAPGALDRLGDEDRLFWLSDRARLLDHADLRQQAIAANQQVIAEAERQQRWLPAADACSNLSVCYLYAGWLHEGTDAAERGIAYNQRAGMDERSVLIDRMNLAGNWRDLGQFDRYLDCAETLPARLRAAGQGFWAANAENDLGVAYSWLGRDDLALRLLSVMNDDDAEIFRASRLITRLRLERDQGARRLAPQPQRLIEQAQVLLEAAGHRSGLLRQALQLERAARQPADMGVPQAQAITDEAVGRQNLLLAIAGLRVRTRLMLAAGDGSGAAASAEALLAMCPGDRQLPSHYAPGLWALAAQALAPSRPARARELMRRAARWVRHAATQVPPLYRQSFLVGNPVNRAVLEAVPDD